MPLSYPENFTWQQCVQRLADYSCNGVEGNFIMPRLSLFGAATSLPNMDAAFSPSAFVHEDVVTDLRLEVLLLAQ